MVELVDVMWLDKGAKVVKTGLASTTCAFPAV
jgi:hypothetical protein